MKREKTVPMKTIIFLMILFKRIFLRIWPSYQKSLQHNYTAISNLSGKCNKIKHVNPTLIITGTEDITSPSANSPLLLEKIPGDWLVQIENGRQRVIKYQFPEKFSKIM